MTPGLVDPSARDPVRHRRLQWAEKRHVPEAGNIVLYDCPCRKYIGRAGRDVRDLVDVEVGVAERSRHIGYGVLKPGRKHAAVGTLIGVSDLRHARPAGGCRHAALVGQLGVGVGVVHDTGLLTYQECTQRPADAVNTEPGQEVEVAVAFLIPEVRPLGPDHLAVETDRVEHARHLMVEMFLVQRRRLASALVDQRTDVEPHIRTILRNGTRRRGARLPW